MRRFCSHPFGQMALVALLASAMVFPHLGTPSLWDDDEGVNAECAREMIEAGNWIVPTFNWELRTAKPIFLYWLLRFSYAAFGVTEFAARLPSAIAFVITAVLTYDLARRMFDKGTGLLAGCIALSSLELVKLGRGCTTDAVLIAFTTLYFWGLYRGTANAGRNWFLPCAAASALATLTKGPLVGLALILGVVGTWFYWNGDLRRLRDRRMIRAGLLWGAIAIPWYAFVSAESHGEWPKEFFLKENLGRSTEPSEAHHGPPIYYLIVICLMFAPWSAFLAVTCWQTWRNCRSAVSEQFRAYRLLPLWVLVYLAAFSIVATKLPHYIAPAYPPLAILTAAAVVRWMRGEVAWPRWGVPGAALGLFATGFLLGTLMLVAGIGEQLGVPKNAMRFFPGLERWAWIGLFPIFGAAAMIVYHRRGNRPAAIAAFSGSTVVFVGLAAAFPPLVMDQYKAAKELTAQSGARQLDREVVIASLDYSQPSVTFYTQRSVRRLWEASEVNDLLASPIPLYLFVKAGSWGKMEADGKIMQKYRIAARRYDFYRNSVILVITNR